MMMVVGLTSFAKGTANKVSEVNENEPALGPVPLSLFSFGYASLHSAPQGP